MTKVPLLLASLLAAAALPIAVAAMPPAQAWEIGPVIKSRNYSSSMPLHPAPVRGGLRIDFPFPDEAAGHVHYVTFRHGPLEGKRRIVMRYRIDAEPSVRFVPRESPALPATLSLFFQQRGDTWTAKGRYETYRWYAPEHTLLELTPGEHVATVELDDPAWISVYAKPAAERPDGFAAALAETDRVGFVLGAASGRGHGVYATGPARLTVLSFDVF